MYIEELNNLIILTSKSEFQNLLENTITSSMIKIIIQEIKKKKICLNTTKDNIKDIPMAEEVLLLIGIIVLKIKNG